MKERLLKLLENSYSPYSHVSVACIVTMNDGNTYSGVNVENASYKEGLCAEQVAISSAITAGYKDGDFKSLDVMGDTKDPIRPCFLCRQLLSEVFGEDSTINCYNKDGKVETYLLKDLCPYAFGVKDLKAGELDD